MKGKSLMRAGSIAKHPKSSTASLRKGAVKRGGKGPYPFHAPAGKLPAKTKGTDA